MSLYIEHCKTAVASIKPDKLAAFPLGDEVGQAGSSFRFHAVGQLDVAEWYRGVGLKVPRLEVEDVRFRLLREVAFLSYCLNSQPRLQARVPSFMGILAVEGSHAQALLTEDVSQGGRHAITPRPASLDTRTMLYAPFSRFGHHEEVLDSVELNHTTAFDVDGQEWLLDFTPLPIHNPYLTKEANPQYWDEYEKTFEATEDLTITIPRDTPLGRDLHNACDFPWPK